MKGYVSLADIRIIRLNCLIENHMKVYSYEKLVIRRMAHGQWHMTTKLSLV